jgi:hypothetical protein
LGKYEFQVFYGSNRFSEIVLTRAAYSETFTNNEIEGFAYSILDKIYNTLEQQANAATDG